MEWFDGENWHDEEQPHETWRDCSRRPKPKPVLRAWSNPSDVPGPVCWVRMNGGESAGMVVGVGPMGICVSIGDGSKMDWWELDAYEYSTTRAADDWHACKTEAP